MMMNRRAFSTALVTGAAASLISTRGMAANSTPAKASNVVLVHGLFADGSCWSEVIARLQAAGLNATAVQSPLTTLPEAVASVQRVLARLDGPTVLVGHSFSGMIVTEAGVDPNVSALVYVAARAPDAGEDYTALAKTYPTPPATAGIVFDGEEVRLSEEAFLRDFAGDLPEAKAKVLYAVQEPFHKALLTGKTRLGAADKSRLSEAMLEAQVAAGYHRADRFHRFLEVDLDDLLVDPRFPDYATDRTDRFMIVEVIISSGRPAGTAANMADEAVRLLGERLHLAPQDILFVFHEVESNLPRFPAASIRREANADA